MPRKQLLSIEVNFMPGALIEEGEGEEQIIYPGIDTWVMESFKDQLKSALIFGSGSLHSRIEKNLGKIIIEVYKE